MLAVLVKRANCPPLAAASLAFVAGATVAYLKFVPVFRHRHIGRRSLEFDYLVGLRQLLLVAARIRT